MTQAIIDTPRLQNMTDGLDYFTKMYIRLQYTLCDMLEGQNRRDLPSDPIGLMAADGLSNGLGAHQHAASEFVLVCPCYISMLPCSQPQEHCLLRLPRDGPMPQSVLPASMPYC